MYMVGKDARLGSITTQTPTCSSVASLENVLNLVTVILSLQTSPLPMASHPCNSYKLLHLSINHRTCGGKTHLIFGRRISILQPMLPIHSTPRPRNTFSSRIKIRKIGFLGSHKK